jgi:hypothetical protein
MELTGLEPVTNACKAIILPGKLQSLYLIIFFLPPTGLEPIPLL